MPVRMRLTDDVWAEIEPLRSAIQNTAGSPPALSARQVIDAVLYVARTGLPQRHLPDAFGHGDAVDNRFRRWEARGIGRHRWACLQPAGCAVATHGVIDRTIVRAHQLAAGARKKPVGRRHRLWAALGVACPPPATRAVAMKRPVSHVS